MDQQLKGAMLADPRPDSPAWRQCERDIAIMVCQRLRLLTKKRGKEIQVELKEVPAEDTELWGKLLRWLLAAGSSEIPETIAGRISLAYLATKDTMTRIREYLEGQDPDKSFIGWCHSAITSALSNLQKTKSPQSWRCTPILPGEGHGEDSNSPGVYAEGLPLPAPTPDECAIVAEERETFHALAEESLRRLAEIADPCPDAIKATIDDELKPAITAYNEQQRASAGQVTDAETQPSETQPKVTRAERAEQYGTTAPRINMGVYKVSQALCVSSRADQRYSDFCSEYVHELPAQRGAGTLPPLSAAACGYIQQKAIELGTGSEGRKWFLEHWLKKSKHNRTLSLRVAVDSAVKRHHIARWQIEPFIADTISSLDQQFPGGRVR